jgi:hypothetical protein
MAKPRASRAKRVVDRDHDQITINVDADDDRDEGRRHAAVLRGLQNLGRKIMALQDKIDALEVKLDEANAAVAGFAARVQEDVDELKRLLAAGDTTEAEARLDGLGAKAQQVVDAANAGDPLPEFPAAAEEEPAEEPPVE